MEVFRESDCFIISDEIYEYINFGEGVKSIGAFEELKDRVITVNGVSKGFAMTGWRIGFLGDRLKSPRPAQKSKDNSLQARIQSLKGRR